MNHRIYTRRLVLRRIEEQDIDRVTGWSGSSEACGPYLTPERYSDEDIRRFIDGFESPFNQGRMFLVEMRDGRAIGTIQYWMKPEDRKTAVMAVKIAEHSERNKGYGTEAQKHLIIHLFTRTPVGAVDMFTDIDNTPQQRCLMKLGFELLDSRSYDDQQIARTGNLYRLTKTRFQGISTYQFHYE
jgi:RimJ/RimL family protein N-acetyltransferase